MNHGQAANFLKVLVATYTDMNDGAISDVKDFLAGVDPRYTDELMAQIKDKHPPHHRIGRAEVSEALTAIRSSAGGEELHYATTTILCQACRREFRFRYAVTEEMPYRGVFSYCPHCGYIPRISFRLEGTMLYYKNEPITDKEREAFRAKKGAFYDAEKDLEDDVRNAGTRALRYYPESEGEARAKEAQAIERARVRSIMTQEARATRRDLE